MQGFDGYKLNLEKDKSYILTRLQQNVVVQLNTKACARNVGLCFRSILITVSGKIFDISIEPGVSGVRYRQLCIDVVFIQVVSVENTRGRYLPIFASQKQSHLGIPEVSEQLPRGTSRPKPPAGSQCCGVKFRAQFTFHQRW